VIFARYEPHYCYALLPFQTTLQRPVVELGQAYMRKPIAEQRENLAVVKTLKVKHAAEVARLERDFFPEGQRNGLVKIKGMIINNERFQSDLTLGLFNKSSLVGYHLAYPLGFRSTSRSKHEKSVYLSDFAVIPAYRNYVKETQGRALSSAIKVFPGRPLLTDAFEDYKNKWIKREAFFWVHGYSLIQCDRRKITRFDKDIFRIRWEPIGTMLHSVKAKYPFRIQPHIAHYLFKLFHLVTKRLG